MCVYCGLKAFGFPMKSRKRSDFIASDASIEQLSVSNATLELVPTLPPSSVADVIIENTNVLTLDARAPLAQALAIFGDKMCRFGKYCGWEPQRSPSTKIIDAGGRTVILGSHFVQGRLTGKQEVSWDGVSSLGRALEMLEEGAKRTPSPQWIQVGDHWIPRARTHKNGSCPLRPESDRSCAATQHVAKGQNRTHALQQTAPTFVPVQEPCTTS
jgi:hypothetical protein